MILSDTDKEFLRLALGSHQTCIHKEPMLCHLLILDELEIRRGGVLIESDEELQACGDFIADAVLESLILKGIVEVTGVDEDGEMLVGLTEWTNQLEEEENGTD